MNEPFPAAGSLWHVAGWTMLHFLWLGCLAWGLAAVLRRATERRAPQLRYACALACLGVLCLLAVGLTVRIAVHGGLLQPAVIPATIAPAADRGALNADRLLQSIHANEELTRTLAVSGSMHLPDAGATTAVWSRTVLPLFEHVARWLPWLWCLGTPAIALMFAAGVAGTFQLRLRSRPVADRAVLATLARLQSALGVGQRVLIAITDHAAAPLVLGIVRPLILLPPSVLSGLSPAQVEMIILHELAHVRRWDNLVNLLQRGVEALLFYHPAVWWASRWARLEREHCCDALVLADGRDPQEYAETLASLALPELAPRYAAAALANHQLVSRIRHILNVENRTMAPSSRSFAVSAVIVACVGGVGLWGLNLLRPRPAVAQEGAAAADTSPRGTGTRQAVGRAVEFLSNQPAPAGAGKGPTPIGLSYDIPVGTADNKELFNFYLGFAGGGDQGTGGVAVGDYDSDGYPDLYVANDDPSAGPRLWSPEQATGAPNVAEAGDNPQAWASLTPDGQEERLLVSYEKAVRAAAVIVYESFNPGALHKVGLYDESGHETIVWEGTDPVRVVDGKGVAVIPVNVNWKAGNVRLYLDSPNVAGWNEIDAVGLLDAATGEVHWATSAQATSTYADRDAAKTHDVTAKEYCQRCHAGVHNDGTVDQIVSGWLRLPTTICPECVQPNRSVSDLSQALIQEYNARARGSLDDRRTVAERLRQELARLEADIVRQEAASMHQVEQDAEIAQQQAASAKQAEQDAQIPQQQAASAKQAVDQQRYANTVRDYYNQLADQERWAARTRDTDAMQQPTLQDIAETLREQQQVIEKLTRALEALHLKLNGPASNSAPAAQDSGNTGDAPDPGSAAATPQRDADLKYFEELLDQANANVDDATYLRRVMLDLAGVPPTPEQVRRFLENAAPDKRKQLLNELLNLASPETLKLLDAWQDELRPGVQE